ncbi:hypothetical protein EUX98_g2973 [Antrodiella citrinella]|uniref:Uncharacterized protein n=1 Tax=Antrodiella citrinella TaxID=2447956 RepID=A0A4S4MXQ8_9APHY|nr:hypothetical protein EUX98_g2973 [Antrodiella citrinella]
MAAAAIHDSEHIASAVHASQNPEASTAARQADFGKPDQSACQVKHTYFTPTWLVEETYIAEFLLDYKALIWKFFPMLPLLNPDRDIDNLSDMESEGMIPIILEAVHLTSSLWNTLADNKFPDIDDVTDTTSQKLLIWVSVVIREHLSDASDDVGLVDDATKFLAGALELPGEEDMATWMTVLVHLKRLHVLKNMIRDQYAISETEASRRGMLALFKKAALIILEILRLLDSHAVFEQYQMYCKSTLEVDVGRKEMEELENIKRQFIRPLIRVLELWVESRERVSRGAEWREQ